MKFDHKNPGEAGGAAATPKPATRQAEPRHFAYIDAVRGLAFLWVLCLHAALVVGPFFGRGLLLGGGYGVQLFFLASAITLCNSMASRQKADRFPIFYFYLRRLFRIAPLFWLAMLFYWTVPVLPPDWSAEWAPTGVHPSYFVLTAIFLHGWHPYTFNSIVPGGWSIAVEMNFYLFFPFMFFLLNSFKRTVIAVLLGLIYVKAMFHDGSVVAWMRHHYYPTVTPSLWEFFLGNWFPAQIPVFLIGFLAYRLVILDPVKSFLKNRGWSLLLLCLFAALLFFFMDGYKGFIPVYLLIVFALGGIVVVMSGKALPWLTNRFFCHVGRLSYSCYLVHFGVLGITLRLFGIHGAEKTPYIDAGHPWSNFWLFLQIFIVALALTVAVSTLTLHLVENPGIALGKKLILWITARFGGRPAAKTA